MELCGRITATDTVKQNAGWATDLESRSKISGTLCAFPPVPTRSGDGKQIDSAMPQLPTAGLRLLLLKASHGMHHS